MRIRVIPLFVLALIFVSSVVPAIAEEPTAVPVVTPAPAPAPLPVATQDAAVVTPDTQILRRSPIIDGIVEEGEWDTFYTYASGDWKATTYANWDARGLCIGVSSNKPVDLQTVLDANSDGWFHGEENYEFRAVRNADGSLLLAVSRYESRNTKAPVASPIADSEAALVDLKSTKTSESYTIEMRIPFPLIRDIKFAPGKKIGLAICIKSAPDDTGWVPSGQPGEVTACELVNKKFATLKPLTLGFDLRDSAVARGEELVGRFHLTNSGADNLDARTFVIAGEGKAGDYLSSEKIRLEGLPPKKHIARDVRTVIPKDMPLGSWAIGAEVRSGENRLGAALVSFDVVDPFEVELRLPSAEVSAAVKDVGFGVVVKNNSRYDVRGKVKITLPIGWELWKNADSREFTARSNGGLTQVQFKAKPPLGEMGNVPVKIEVTVGKQTKTVEGKFTVVNP